jgi:hypothetical protein
MGVRWVYTSNIRSLQENFCLRREVLDSIVIACGVAMKLVRLIKMFSTKPVAKIVQTNICLMISFIQIGPIPITSQICFRIRN